MTRISVYLWVCLKTEYWIVFFLSSLKTQNAISWTFNECTNVNRFHGILLKWSLSSLVVSVMEIPLWYFNNCIFPCVPVDILHLSELVQSVRGQNWSISLGLPSLKCVERKIDASIPFKPLRGWANIPLKPLKVTGPSPLQISLSCSYSSSFVLCSSSAISWSWSHIKKESVVDLCLLAAVKVIAGRETNSNILHLDPGCLLMHYLFIYF